MVANMALSGIKKTFIRVLGRLLRPSRALLATMLLASALPASAQDISPGSSEIAAIRARGYLVVAIPAFDAPPFFLERDGELKGLDVDLAQGLGQALGVELRFDRSARSFNETIDRVAQGTADIAWCKLSRTLHRASSVRFSEPYLVLRHALAFNRVQLAELARGNPVPPVIRGYTGKLAILAGSAWIEYANTHFPAATKVEYADNDEMIRHVREGIVTAAYRDEFVIKRAVQLDPALTVSVRTITLKDLEDPLAVAVNPTQSHLLDFINLFLASQRKKLTVDSILQDYAGLLQ